MFTKSLLQITYISLRFEIKCLELIGMYLWSDLITTPLCLNIVQCFRYLFLFFPFTSGQMFFFMDIMWFWSNFTLANEKIRKLYCLLSGLKHQGHRNRKRERERLHDNIYNIQFHGPTNVTLFSTLTLHSSFFCFIYFY